jgi:enoyl-CoA hydratase/carnithine racemase
MRPVSDFDIDKDTRFEIDGPVATITFTRPEVLNAVNGGIMHGLLRALDTADKDDTVRALIVTGAGRAFCSGADLSRGEESFKEGSAESARRPDGTIDYDHPSMVEGSGPLALALFNFTKPIICAINGPCAGLGASMTLPMDIRLASESATYNFVFARRGMLPECASSWFLPRLVGMSKALEWCYTGRRVTAQEALAAGLVSEVLAPEDLLPRARALAMEIAENSAPVSVSLIRQMFWRAQGLDHPLKAHKVESWGAWHRSRSADSAEGVRSFFEKRPPDFPMHVPSDLPDFYPWWDEPDLWKARD